MGIDQRANHKGFRGGWSVPPKPCDSCKVAEAAVFCLSDSAFLCIACDDKIHVASRHERVWVCEVCERAPASVTCKADAAALCVTCDSDIHSANPLARRHERLPLEPFLDSAAEASASAFNFPVPSAIENEINDDAEAAASWLFPNPNVHFTSKIMDSPDIKSGSMFFSEMDPFLDFEYSNSFQNNNHSTINDSVVPVKRKNGPATLMNHHSEASFDTDFCRSKLSSFNYPTRSISQSVSLSSLEVAVVPDTNTVSDISYPFGRNMSDSSGIVSVGSSAVSQLPGMDREARVLRYREKRKNRKFEKTIRYASRKAYAETRPRIKGRFAKRTQIESDVDQLYGPAGTEALMMDAQYGVVPSF